MDDDMDGTIYLLKAVSIQKHESIFGKGCKAISKYTYVGRKINDRHVACGGCKYYPIASRFWKLTVHDCTNHTLSHSCYVVLKSLATVTSTIAFRNRGQEEETAGQTDRLMVMWLLEIGIRHLWSLRRDDTTGTKFVMLSKLHRFFLQCRISFKKPID